MGIAGTSENMARTVYYVSDLQQLSDKAKARFEETFGPPVPFPTKEECKAELENSKDRYRKFFASFKPKRGKKGGTCEHDEFGLDLLAPDSEAEEGIAAHLPSISSDRISLASHVQRAKSDMLSNS